MFLMIIRRLGIYLNRSGHIAQTLRQSCGCLISGASRVIDDNRRDLPDPGHPRYSPVVLQDKVLADRYTLLTPLGRGGMGQVWEARDDHLDRAVAVKLLDTLEADSEHTRRFTREVAVTAGLSHPGVPAIYDAGEYDGGRYLVMELVEGCTIADLIAEEGPLPVPWVAGIGAQIAAVLAAAHDRGFVHRDIKPQNVMITADGSVKILDFGVASVASIAEVQRLTGTGVAVGTPAYMAPEQSHSLPATPRTDLYALGCLLYEMLSGGPLFSAGSPAGLMRMHLEQAPAPLPRGDLPPELDGLIRQLLAKDPAWRPADAVETYERLLPFVIPPGPIGDITPAAHRYAAAQARLTAAQPPPRPAAPLPPRPGLAAHAHPPAYPHYQADPALRQGAGWTVRHSLWVLPTLLFGWAAWLSFGYIGVRHQRRSWLIAAVAYFVVPAIGFALIVTGSSSGSNLSTQTYIGLALWLLPWPAGFIHAIWVNFSARLPLLRQTS